VTFEQIVEAVQKLDGDLTPLELSIFEKALADTVDQFVASLGDDEPPKEAA